MKRYGTITQVASDNRTTVRILTKIVSFDAITIVVRDFKLLIARPDALWRQMFARLAVSRCSFFHFFAVFALLIQIDIVNCDVLFVGAQAEVSVRLAQNDYSVTSRGADPETLVASAKAYLGALNKLLARGARTHAQHSAQ